MLFIHSSFDGFGGCFPLSAVLDMLLCGRVYEYLLSPCFQQFGVQALLCFPAPECGEGRLPSAVQCVGTVCLCVGHAEGSAPSWRACGSRAASFLLVSDYPERGQADLSWLLCSPGLGAGTRARCMSDA